MNYSFGTSQKSLGSLLIVFTFLFAFTACSDDDPVSDPPIDTDLNIVETAVEAGNFTILIDAATDLGLADFLSEEELTLFAPTDEAFEALPDGVLESLTAQQLETILTFHLLEASVLAEAISDQQDAETLLGERLLLQRSGSTVTINGSAMVEAADIVASNGVIHAINEVLIPAEIRAELGMPNIIDVARGADGFDIVLGAIEDTGLTTTLKYLGPYTVFPPTDEAFEVLGLDVVESLTAEELTEILLYHVIGTPVLSGDLADEQAVESLTGEDLFITAVDGVVTINGNSNVILADVEAANGVIHAVDRVLLPDAFGTVVDNAVKRFDLTTLVELVSDQGLAPTLADTEAEYTVFAPTNEAFEAIAEVLEGLSEEQVTNTLLYHVLGAAVASGDLQASQSVATLNDGEEILVEVTNGTVTINGEAVVQIADISGANGIIHIIDAVLIPEELGGGVPGEQVSATVTINNIGSSAWTVEDVDGEGASAETGGENTPITLQEGLRYTIVNLGANNHPLQLRDANGDILVAAQGNGELQNYEPANVVVDEDEGSITFTLTGNLADWVATYNCAPHAAMEGELIVSN